MKLLSQIRVLSEDEMDRIFDGALDIVESISMQVRHAKMLQVLHDYGCEVDMEKQRVRFPMSVLQSLLDDIETQKAKARETPVEGEPNCLTQHRDRPCGRMILRQMSQARDAPGPG